MYHEQRAGEEGRSHPLDERRDQIDAWRQEGYSFLVIHELLRQRGVKYSETTVRRYIHRHFPSPVRPVMRRETKPGEVMEVDFGQLGLTWDAATRSRKRTWVFSGRLRHFRRAYREVVFDQKQETFFACHMHAFEWFGGVPEKVTPDNLKAAVIVASFEDPLVNRAYRELALHYGFLISPCLPRRPEHKGGWKRISSMSRETFCRCSIATAPTNEPWNIGGDTYRHIRAAVILRERLRPYVLAQMKVAAERGIPPMRPLFFGFPDDTRAAAVADQFLFGPDLLVAPITVYRGRERRVYLPAGAEWSDAWNGDRVHAGGTTVAAAAPIERASRPSSAATTAIWPRCSRGCTNGSGMPAGGSAGGQDGAATSVPASAGCGCSALSSLLIHPFPECRVDQRLVAHLLDPCEFSEIDHDVIVQPDRDRLLPR